MTLNDLPNLTAPQRALLASISQIVDIGGAVQSTVTYSQAKAARAYLANLYAVTAPIQRGMQLLIERHRTDALNAFDQNNP